MKVFYSCVTDTHPKYQYQCWLWVHSLLDLAKVSPSDIWVAYLEGADPAFLGKLQRLGVNLRMVERFGDGKYCNKIQQLTNPALGDADLIVLMDTDTLVMRNFTDEVPADRVSGKIVDMPNPPAAVLEKIFHHAKLENRLGLVKTDLADEWTFPGNFNGGLYVIPKQYAESIAQGWKKWALWLLETKLLHEAKKEMHVDQVSFCMTLHERQIPMHHLERKYNYPVHLSYYKDEIPAIFHYHWELTPTGLLKTDPNSSDEYKNAVIEANEMIHKHFDNVIFWNFRYSTHPELGSGIGSRGENLAIKKDYLRRLKIEDHSVLDIGCGDLELMKEFQIASYIGIDASEQALSIASRKRPDWRFVQWGSDQVPGLPAQDYVTCFDVLIHQKTKKDFDELISYMISKANKRLLVSGYSRKESHHDTNHMLAFHESLEEILKSHPKFESVVKLFRINDTDYYVCDVKFDKQFWLDFFSGWLADKLPGLAGKTIYLTPNDTKENGHHDPVRATLQHDWMAFAQFFERMTELTDRSGELVLSCEGFRQAHRFSEMGKCFWEALGRVADLRPAGGMNEFWLDACNNRQLPLALKTSTGAPNDMAADVLESAWQRVEHPDEFIECVSVSRKIFGWYTKHYPRIFEYPWLLNRLKGDLRGTKIAELGAGLSPLPVILAGRGAIVTTVDNHPNVRNKADLFHANEWGFFDYSQIHGSIVSLNITMDENTFAERTFDVWYSVSVLEHVPAEVRRKLFAWIRRSLKPEGRFLLTVDLVKNTNLLWNFSEGVMVEDHERHGTLQDLENELKSLGFKIRENRSLSMPDTERVDIALIDASL